jgi:hypothetical protein
MIVVLDTSIWKNELYLTGASAAFKLYLRRSGAIIAMSEVIRLENRNPLRADLIKGRESRCQAPRGKSLKLLGRAIG